MHFEGQFLLGASRTRPAVVVGLVITVLAVAGAAQGADADALIREALELRRAGHDQEALSLFQQAVQARRTPRALAQLGLCQQALGLWPAAERHLEEALAGEGDDAWRAKNAKPLREALAFVKRKIGSVEVWGTPEGATVRLDDEAAGTLPLRSALRVAEGHRTFRVEAPGFVAETRTIDVRGGTAVREHVALVRSYPDSAAPVQVLARPKDAAPDGGLAVGRAVDAPLVSGNDAGPRAAAAPIYTRWWFWTAIAAGVIGAGVVSYLAVRKDGGGCVPQAGAPCW